MSIKTTHDIDRVTALSIILSRVVNLDNDELAVILEMFPESHFRNYRVYNDLPTDGWEYRIESISDF